MHKNIWAKGECNGDGFAKVFWGCVSEDFNYQSHDLISDSTGSRRPLSTLGKEGTGYDCDPLKCVTASSSLVSVDTCQS